MLVAGICGFFGRWKKFPSSLRAIAETKLLKIFEESLDAVAMRDKWDEMPYAKVGERLTQKGAQ